ncbi:MAG TPA: methyltransferase [Stellaceae bacterium]|nr:methyltransferase [Stellaceae bacterium]
MAEVTPDPIMRIALGFMAAKHLFVASAIGLFEGLASGPATLDELAAKCGVPRRTLGISADAMASLGLVERDGDRYRNSAAAAAFLSGGRGADLRPMLRFWDRISYPAWMRLETAVRAGEGQSYFDRFSAEEQQIFSTGVEAFTAGAAAALAAAYDFAAHRRVLDIAGGTGSFLVAILRRYPGLQGTLFELPGTCVVARQRLADVPEGARVAVVEGDLLTDPIPDGHDVMIAANIVHGLSAAHNIALLNKARAHAVAGGRLLLVDLWMDPSHTEPPAAPLMSGEFLVHSGEGQSYAEADADAWLAPTGWRKLERRPLAGPASVIIAEAA